MKTKNERLYALALGYAVILITIGIAALLK